MGEGRSPEEEAHIEVLVGRRPPKGWDGVNIHVEQGSVVLQRDTDLLGHLATGRSPHRLVRGIDVSARLQPPVELAVKHQQQLGAVRREEEGARREVPRHEVGSREWISGDLAEREHAPQVVGLEGIRGPMPLQEGTQ